MPVSVVLVEGRDRATKLEIVIQRLFAEADACRYRAKQQGRNQAVIGATP